MQFQFQRTKKESRTLYSFSIIYKIHLEIHKFGGKHCILYRFDVRISSSYSNSAEYSYWCSISRKMKMVNQKREKSKTTKLLLLFFSNCKIFHHERTLALVCVCVCVSVNLVDYMPACHSQPASQPVCRRQCVCVRVRSIRVCIWLWVRLYSCVSSVANSPLYYCSGIST